MIAKLKAWYKREIKKEREGLRKTLELDGHTYYIMDSLPNYCVNRFFYFISKNEEISTLGVPLDYFTAIADQLDANIESPKLKQNVPKLSELIRFAVKKQENKWYWLTVAVVEAFVLIDDEPLNEISHAHNKLKRDLLNNSPDLRFFFTNIATQYLNSLDSTFKTSEFEEFWQKMTTSPDELLANIGT